MERKGFTAIVIILTVVIVFALAGGVWYYRASHSKSSSAFVTENQVIGIALKAAGVSTSTYQVFATLNGNEWNVGVVPRQPVCNNPTGPCGSISGGNVEYTISATSGVIIATFGGQ